MTAAEAKLQAEQRQVEVVESEIALAISRGAFEAYFQLQLTPALTADLTSRGYTVEQVNEVTIRISWN